MVSVMTMQGHPKTSRGTQYQGALNSADRLRQPKVAYGANGLLQPDITCFYCKDTGYTKNKCVWVNNKIACDFAQEQLTTRKASGTKK